jgi:hypothetical protein
MMFQAKRAFALVLTSEFTPPTAAFEEKRLSGTPAPVEPAAPRNRRPGALAASWREAFPAIDGLWRVGGTGKPDLHNVPGALDATGCPILPFVHPDHGPPRHNAQTAMKRSSDLTDAKPVSRQQIWRRKHAGDDGAFLTISAGAPDGSLFRSLEVSKLFVDSIDADTPIVPPQEYSQSPGSAAIVAEEAEWYAFAQPAGGRFTQIGFRRLQWTT